MLYLGFDVSTQQLKIIVTTDQLEVYKTYFVEFDAEFKLYGITKGVISEDDGTIVSPVSMWLDALDHVFDKMKQDDFPFDQVGGISGSCQQHGSVFWNKNASQLLGSLDPKSSLKSNLSGALAYEYSPNWQDHSTGKELHDFDTHYGVDKLAQVTGSKAHYRFTGLQIRKLATRADREIYDNTSRISLVSSFIASILLGKIAPIEEADACGMNLYDVENGEYDDELLALAAGVDPTKDGVEKNSEKYKDGIKQVKEKLGRIDPITFESLGSISLYFVEKYKFNKDCKIYSFTGDNLATIISLPLAPNDYLISLGTSTTVLIITKNYNPSPLYHLFKHPTMKGYFMGMICYCNGSLAREKVRNEVNKKYNVEDKNSWDEFNRILDSHHDFNNKLGIYFPLGEIVPNAKAQTKRSILQGDEVVDVEIGDKWDVEDDVTSIVTSQTLSCRLRGGPMLSNEISKDAELEKLYDDLKQRFGEISTDGHKQTFESLMSRPHRCYYVGGASKNPSIIKKMGSILSPKNGNYKVEIPNACALGGAFKASWSHLCETRGFVRYDEYIQEMFDKKGELEEIKVEDQWVSHFNGCGMLSKMESELEH